MKTNMRPSQLVVIATAFAVLMGLGCEAENPARTGPAKKGKNDPPQSDPPSKVVKADPPPKDPLLGKTTDPVKPPPSDDLPPMQSSGPVYKEPPAQEGWKRTKPLGENIWLEIQGDKRRVLVAAAVCMREANYGLECLLCKRGTKEHESILVTTADARTIHGALEVAKVKAGAPVQYEPKFLPPRGDKVKITILYEEKGKWVSVPAQSWIRHGKTKKDLEQQWVFAGSMFYQNPEEKEKPPIYLATNDGGYICVSNVPSAMLDLPIDSPKAIDGRIYEPNTARIPPLDTSVTLILEPFVEPKK